jgi:ABC-type multidrug transport system fused ATPase/permease subunit
VKKWIKAAVLKQSPLCGTLWFAVAYSLVNVAADWIFRWSIPANPMPPVWSVIVTVAIGTFIASVFVFVLLIFMQRQQRALEELNHELRNSLQVLSYSVYQCDEEVRPKAEAAIGRLSDTVRRVTQKLGMVSERRFRPKR